jgi:phosphocarrier protein
MEKKIKVNSTQGLHAILASKVVQLSSKYDAEINVVYEDKVIDAKSILGLMSLAVPAGDNIVVTAKGDDAEKAIKEIKKILN